MIQKIKDFLKTHTITANTIAGAWAFLAGAYITVPAFKSEVDLVWAHVPSNAKALTLAISGLVALYFRSHPHKENQ